MQRRDILKAGLAGLAAAAVRPVAGIAAAQPAAGAPVFSTANLHWQRAYDRALDILAANVQVLPRFPCPVLIEGSEYSGIWQECGPHESLVYRHFRPDAARNAHMTFFTLQREDGQLPANNKRTEDGFGQIQMVVPIAATAWELANATGDTELLEKAYDSCSRWDAWLMRYRNTRRTGLVEAFCTFDTGMDNSPRWAGLPSQCPGKDAKRCPPFPSLPRLAPDLSATTYGGRVALSAMADALGWNEEAEQWREKAESLRGLIFARLYNANDAAFYDLDAQNRFVQVRSDIMTRLCGEHVLDGAQFKSVWQKQLGNPAAFWAPFPFPSIALGDPTFVRPIPGNSWGGAAQALTALRAGRWMDHYGKSAEFGHLMQQWCEAVQRDMSFRQQIDPVTGAFTQADKPNYSPAALVMYDFTWRLAGVHEQQSELHWNVRPRCPGSDHAIFHRTLDNSHQAALRYFAKHAELKLNDRPLLSVDGCARIVTDKAGRVLYALGIDPEPQQVTLRFPTAAPRRLLMKPNVRQALV